MGENFKIEEKSPALATLFSFSFKLGITLNPKVTYPVTFPPGYPGVLVLSDLSPNEVILTAPNSAMLSINLSNTETLKPLYSDYPEDFSLGNGGENNRFIAFLLSELSKGSASKWHPYLRSLPENIEVLSDWSSAELSELQDPALQEYSIARHTQDKECNLALQEILANYPSIFSPQEICKVGWAWKVICTRAYGKCLPHLSLIPLADLFNHQNVETCYFYGKADEIDDGYFDKGDDDSDDSLPFKAFVVSNFKLARLAIGKQKGSRVDELLEKAKDEDRRVFVRSKRICRVQASY